jgi:Ca2+-binding EF-hand superfamily protein
MDMIGKPMEEAQLKAFMRKVDKDMDGKIVYSEFLEAFFSPDSESNMMKTSMDLGSSRTSTSIRMSSPKRTAMTSPKRKNYEKDDQYMDYVRKSYTSPKRDDRMKNIKMTTSELYSPSKKLAFEEGERYRTPTKSSRKGDDEIMRESMSASKQSPLKPNDEAEMVTMLKEMVDMNRETETMKNELSMRRDFNLFNAFNILDKDRKGYATMKDLEKMMNRYNMYPTKDELYMMFKKFDTMMNGIVKYFFISHTNMPGSMTSLIP